MGRSTLIVSLACLEVATRIEDRVLQQFLSANEYRRME